MEDIKLVNIITWICIIFLSFATIITSTYLVKKNKEIKELENKINYVLWEKEYIDHAVEDALQQY